MRLIITRHGETIENAEGIIQGHLPGRLSKKGIEEAKRVAKRLKDEKIDYIYSSDLARAADTAKEIGKFHPTTPIKFVKELRERNLGEFQGVRKSDIGWDKKKSLSTLVQPKRGESLEQLYFRAKKFLDKILHKHREDTVLFVGHNGISKALICVIINKSPKELRNLENLKNTSINIFDMDEEKNHKIHLFNCTKHLA